MAFTYFFRDQQTLDLIAQHVIPELKRHMYINIWDAGCAMGFLVEELRRTGVEAYGVDISEYAIKNTHQDIKEYCWVGSIANPLPQKYDLIVSIEVVEHMPKQEAEAAVGNICRYSDDILFSSTPYNYKEATHLNVQPPEHWSELFARHGFLRDIDFDASFITPWAVRYRRSSEPLPRLVRDYERKHFTIWKENQEVRGLVLDMREQLSRQEDDINELGELLQDHREQLKEIQDSKSWRVISWFQRLRLRLIPQDSSQERFLNRFFSLFKG